MPQDRIIRFTKTAPSKKDLQYILEDYFSEIGAVRWDKDRFFCDLPGKCSNALRRVVKFDLHPMNDERWIEVWRDKHVVDIMTRSQDNITNVIADGLAELIALFYRGTIEE